MYAFIHIPKTGGTTFRSILRSSFGSRHCDIKKPSRERDSGLWIGREDLRRARWIYPSLAGVSGHRVACFSDLESAAPDIRYCTFLREPRARFRSHFAHTRRGKPGQPTRQDFLQFCQDARWRNVQTRWIAGAESAAQAILALDRHQVFAGLTEQYNVSLLLFRVWLGIPSLSLRYATRNRNANGFELDIGSDHELLSEMEDANREDIALYRHVAEVDFPRRIATYPGDLEADLEHLRALNGNGAAGTEGIWSRIKRNYLYKPLLHVC